MSAPSSPTHRRHHFVPRFYLKHWTGADEKLACYRWARGRILVSRLAPKSVAFKEDLYSLPGAPINQRQHIEKQFFALVDDRAARAYKQLIEYGVAALSDHERVDWAVFLLSLRIRTPQSISRIKQEATSDFVNGLNRDPEKWAAIRKETDPDTLLEWIQQNRPDMIANYGISIVPQLIVSDRSLGHLVGMHWWTQRLDGAGELVTSDHPCVYTTGFAYPNCIVALPLTPKVVFYAANSRNVAATLKYRAGQQIAARTNESVISQAFEYVYALDGNRKLLVGKHLRRYIA